MAVEEDGLQQALANLKLGDKVQVSAQGSPPVQGSNQPESGHLGAGGQRVQEQLRATGGGVG